MSVAAREIPGNVTHAHQTGPRWAFVAAGAIYCLTLHWSYANVESSVYAYTGATYNAPPLAGALATFLLALAPTLWIAPTSSRPSSVALTVFYILVYAPFVLIAPYVMPWAWTNVLLLDLFLLLNLGLISVVTAFPRRPFAQIAFDERAYLIGIVMATLGLTLVTAATNDFRLDLSVSDVYARRLAARERVVAGSIAGYVIAILRTTLLPLTLIVGIIRRQAILVLVSMIAVVALFSLAGQKSVPLTPVFIGGAYVLATKWPRWFAAMASLAAAGIIALADYVYLVHGNLLPTALITYRLFVAAAINMSRYFVFFADHPFYYMSWGPLRSVMPSEYDRPMTMMMGSLYDPSGQLNLNSNVWATAYGDGGYPAVLIASLLIGVLLWLLDSWSRGRYSLAFVVFGAFLGFLLAAMALSTALLTGGVVPTMIALYFLSGTTSRRRAISNV